MAKKKKKIGVTDFVLERTSLEKYAKSEKSGIVFDKGTVSIRSKILQLNL